MSIYKKILNQIAESTQLDEGRAGNLDVLPKHVIKHLTSTTMHIGNEAHVEKLKNLEPDSLNKHINARVKDFAKSKGIDPEAVRIHLHVGHKDGDAVFKKYGLRDQKYHSIDYDKRTKGEAHPWYKDEPEGNKPIGWRGGGDNKLSDSSLIRKADHAHLILSTNERIEKHSDARNARGVEDPLAKRTFGGKPESTISSVKFYDKIQKPRHEALHNKINDKIVHALNNPNLRDYERSSTVSKLNAIKSEIPSSAHYSARIPLHDAQSAVRKLKKLSKNADTVYNHEANTESPHKNMLNHIMSNHHLLSDEHKKAIEKIHNDLKK